MQGVEDASNIRHAAEQVKIPSPRTTSMLSKVLGFADYQTFFKDRFSLCKGHILVPNKNMQSGSLTNICALYITWECLHQLSPNRSTHSGRP